MIIMTTQTITIRNKKYRLNVKRFGIIMLSLFLAILFISYQTHKLFSSPKAAQVETSSSTSTAAHLSSVVETSTDPSSIVDDSFPVEEVAKEVVKSPSIMSSDRFESQANRLFPKVPVPYFASIYKEAIDNELPPYFPLGIAWKESHFNPKAIGPTTRYGTARGLFQIIESTASELLSIKDASKLYEPEVAIAGGTKVLGTYRNWLSGKTDNKTPEVFTHFTVKDNAVYYKGEPVLDQKGDKVPLLLMTAISYNGGPGVITAALKRDGVLVLDPTAKNCNIPTQSLDYVYQINKYVYNFEYEFAYSNSDIDRSKIF